MKIIAFHENSLNIRGSSVSLYDYAHYNEIMLGNKSIILIPKSSIKERKNDQIAINKFKKRFRLFFYDDFEQILEDEKCDVFYVIKYGTNDGIFSRKIKTCVHCVFSMTEEHGDVYAGVSQQIAEKFGKTLFVPHMISLEQSKTDENLRAKLGIPLNGKVFGYHGGNDSFNILFAIESVKRAVRVLDNIWFVFINIPKFDNHPNIFFLEKITDPDEKNKFISTCDACIEAQRYGQSFGLSLGEFSVNNKPIITYGGYDVMNDNYKKILGNNALYYNNQEELMNIFSDFDKSLYINKDLNFYKEYSPEKVMEQFAKIFL